MPVFEDSPHVNHDRSLGATTLGSRPSLRFQDESSRCLTIGLVNNMPDEALKATERQFLSLLEKASEGMLIRLSYYMLPEVPRQEQARRHLNNSYTSVADLRDRRLDGLIVTGREPLSANLAEEPYWDSFTKLVDWAQHNTNSTVWSCLAAHAAILHLDGIVRVRSDNKVFGIFECSCAATHSLTAGTPSRFRLPHSRWNGVPEEALTDCGYSVLTRAADAGVDTFVKQQQSLFVFFQGHPEYESDTLLREYRRDIGRYVRGETETCPLIPRGYFDDELVNALTTLQERAACGRNEGLQREIETLLGERKVENTWDSSATSIYRNWLEYLCAHKERTLRSKRMKAMASAPPVRWAGTLMKRSDRGLG
jgi:homoserine O-succinyltransferase/O-acetyltransferase